MTEFPRRRRSGHAGRARRSGPSALGRIARVVVPGVRRVHGQVLPYARLWDEANAAALAAEGPLWAVLGDSTAQGIGAPSYDRGYVGQLRRRLGEDWRVLNWSRSGARVSDVMATQLPLLEALDPAPELVTCAIGANDLYPTPLDALLDGLRHLMARLPDGAVIATLPQGMKTQKAMAANEVIRTEAPAAGLRVADVWAHTGPPWHGKYAEDRFHPGAVGYADWANAFADAIGLPPPAYDAPC